MGFLDRAKKLAEQAKDLAGETVDKAKTQMDERRERQQEQPAAAPSHTAAPAGGRVWEAVDLRNPAALLDIHERHAKGIHHSTKSQIVTEPHGVGRRWSANGKSVAFLWLLEPGMTPTDAGITGNRWREVRLPGAVDVPGVGDGAYLADVSGGRGVFVLSSGVGFVVEGAGLDDAALTELASSAAARLQGGS